MLSTKEVYHLIYEKRYSLSSEHVAEATKYINKNMRQLIELGFENNELKICTAGTGREVKAWSLMESVANVYHYDLSEKAVETVSKIKAEGKEIRTKKLNFCCKREEFKKETDDCKDYNLVYLSGVFHHFEEPFSALGNICDSINDKCWFFLRIYRAGTLRWSLVSLIRPLVKESDPNRLISVANEIYNNLSFGDILTNSPSYIVENFIDNMYVPNCHLFDPKQLQDVLEDIGMEVKCWSDPWSEGDLGFMGEEQTINGSTVIFKIKDTELLMDSCSKLSERNNELLAQTTPDRCRIMFDQLGISEKLDEILMKIKKARNEKEKLQFCLILTTFAEAKYINKRFKEQPVFNIKLAGIKYQELVEYEGTSYMAKVLDSVNEVISEIGIQGS